MIKKRVALGSVLVCVLMLLFTASVVFAGENGNFGSDVRPSKVDEPKPEATPLPEIQTTEIHSSPLAPPAESVEKNEVAANASLPHAKKYEVGFTAAVAIPQPLTIGVQAHRVDNPYLDAFYEAGFFKYPLTSSTRSGSDYSFVAGVRYHPFQNWFYTSAELGFRHIGISVDISNLKQDGVALANTATMSIGTFFLGLLVGGEWKLSENLSLAMDLGIQFALLHTGGIAIHADPSQDDGTDLSVDSSKEMGRISGLPLPQIALFRFVWYI